MIFFVANDGTIIKSLPSPVYQGAANSNTIYLVAPFAANMTATVAFQLPNGVWTEPALMTPQNGLDGILNEKSGKEYAIWTYALPNEITRYYGTVTAQFFFYAAQAGVVTAISATHFTVGRGVPAILPDTPTDNIYQGILSNLSALQEQLDNGAYAARSIYAWNNTYQYGANEIVFVASVGEYGAFAKSLVANNISPPFNALGEINPNWELVVDFNDIYTYARYGVGVQNATLTFSPLDPNVSVSGETLIITRSL